MLTPQEVLMVEGGEDSGGKFRESFGSWGWWVAKTLFLAGTAMGATVLAQHR